MQHLQEDFLHFIWQARYFDHAALQTAAGDHMHIVNTGYSNSNSGPDFLEAIIRINGVDWSGHVEIHKKSSDWYVHKHDRDPSYDAVVLHVVYKADRMIFRTDGTPIPQLELSRRIPRSAKEAYASLCNTTDRIPCRKLVNRLDPFDIALAQERMFVERMLERSAEVIADVHSNGGDWNLTFWKLLCSGFGLKVNKEGFKQLSTRFPLSILRRNSDNLMRIEALLFGCAGMLYRKPTDDYTEQLIKEFDFLKHKYNLHTMIPVVWRFHRMRPHNFPTIRIAQLAMLIYTVGIESNSRVYKNPPELLIKKLQAGTSPYWETHYRFGQESRASIKKPGKQFIESLWANAIAPFQYSILYERGDWEAQTEVLDMLTRIDGEHNRVTREFIPLGFATRSMADTQSLLQLFNNYCTLKRCVNCTIGKHILSHEKKSS
ncbi:MAG: DUF2851 family protein [Flavobacteriales bacterium]|nr:DUF2851 family protein [Flavobacteriales bacterium]